MIWVGFITIDTFTNLCCIILTNTFSTKYYIKLCKCIDTPIRQCFMNRLRSTSSNSATSTEIEIDILK